MPCDLWCLILWLWKQALFLVLHEFPGLFPAILLGGFPPCTQVFPSHICVDLLKLRGPLCWCLGFSAALSPADFQLPWPPWIPSSSSSTLRDLGVSWAPFLPTSWTFSMGSKLEQSQGLLPLFHIFQSVVFFFFALFCLMSKFFRTIVWYISSSVFIFVFSLGFFVCCCFKRENSLVFVTPSWLEAMFIF